MDNSFLHENFLLSTQTSEKLCFEVAQSCPIFDYHCHIPPADIAGNRRFENLTQIWLAEGRYGDHYKWRAMRANGVPERFITGNASDYQKFRRSREPFRLRFAMRSTIGRTWNCAAISGSRNF